MTNSKFDFNWDRPTHSATDKKIAAYLCNGKGINVNKPSANEDIVNLSWLKNQEDYKIIETAYRHQFGKETPLIVFGNGRKWGTKIASIIAGDYYHECYPL